MPISLFAASADVCTMKEQHWGKSEHPLPYSSLFNRDTYSVKRRIQTDMFLFRCFQTGSIDWLTSSILILLWSGGACVKGAKAGLLALSTYITSPLNTYTLCFYLPFFKDYKCIFSSFQKSMVSIDLNTVLKLTCNNMSVALERSELTLQLLLFLSNKMLGRTRSTNHHHPTPQKHFFFLHEQNRMLTWFMVHLQKLLKQTLNPSDKSQHFLLKYPFVKLLNI